MNKNTRIVSLAAIGAVALLAGFLIVQNLILTRPTDVICSDGPRRTIDIRDFITRYSAYSVEFEATIADGGRFAGALKPTQLQALSEASQQANEFRKYVVAGYNSCAISGAQYSELGSRFQALDGLARQIDKLARAPQLSGDEQARLVALVTRYGDATQELGTVP